MKVECINDKDQGYDVDAFGNLFDAGDRVKFGDIYEVIGHYTCHEGPMFILKGMDRKCSLYGNGWGTHRFKPLNRKTKTEEKERVLEQV